MPTYEYECSKCGKKFDLFQGMTEPHVKKCPDCSGAVRRLISGGGGIIFKGSGFYATDYRSSSYKDKEKSENKSKEPLPCAGSKKECATCPAARNKD